MGNSNGGIGRTWRLGVVSFLNAKPLIAGLDAMKDVELIYAVPSRLPPLLDAGAVDVALVPVIDLGRNQSRWQIVSDACIGCDGETLTVRVFSKVPPGEVHTLYVDGDSHTSVALAAVVWKELYGRSLRIMPLLEGEGVSECEAVLLIGDKVVSRRPGGFDVEIDLGAAWKTLTSLPFVFAVWAAPRELEVAKLAPRLEHARNAGVSAAPQIAARFGPAHGWPVALAEEYLMHRLRFTLGDREQRGMTKFIETARASGLLLPSVQEPVCT